MTFARPRTKSHAIREPLESMLIRQIMLVARNHPRVAFVLRMNTGSIRDKTDRPVFFGAKGFPDIFGVTKAGVFFAFEVKRPSQAEYTPKKATSKAAIHRREQQEWVDRINKCGVAAIVSSHQEVRDILDWIKG